MTNPLLLKGRFLFHITHITNLPGILKKGILAKNEAESKNIKYKDVSNLDVQQGRAQIHVPPPDGKHTLRDYVPLFFGARPAMLFAVQRSGVSQEEMIYALVNWGILELKSTWFTDGNARSGATKFFNDVKDLSKVNWKAVEAYYWGDKGEDFKRQKQAEVLKFGVVSLSDISAFCVYNQKAKDKVQAVLDKQDISKKAFITPEFYY